MGSFASPVFVRREIRAVLPIALLVLFVQGGYLGAASSQVTVKDGRVLAGAMTPVESVATRPEMLPKRNPRDANRAPERIVVVDDQLRQTYIPRSSVEDVQPDEIAASLEIFKIPQPINRSQGGSIASLGSLRTTVPFDEFGRRTLPTPGGPLIQAITEISPRWIRVQGINLAVDMRLSPHSFPPETLRRLIKKQINEKLLDDRLRVYQFYVQAELFEQASEEMGGILTDFSDDAEHVERLSVGLRMIRQLAANRLIDELELRRLGGQHQNVRALLAEFESQGTEGISFEKIQAIRRMAILYTTENQTREAILARLENLAESLDNADHQHAVRPLLDEIAAELNSNTLDRFGAFQLAEQDATLDASTRLAIALSGWLAGNAATETRLELVLSMARVREQSLAFLRDPDPQSRNEWWEKIRTEEAASAPRVAAMVQRMRPPADFPAGDPDFPGFYQIDLPSFEEGGTFSYSIQLPSEYDPNRKYPLVVTLHGERTTPELQIDWWAGPWKENSAEAIAAGGPKNRRYGQAARFGCIVMAPCWGENSDATWDYSPAQSGAVLYALRDAIRRFSIHSDQIFLSGHSSGADGVWDLGLALPDLWAGLIPICGRAVKYPQTLRKNAEFVPIYGVGGELDGGCLAACRRVFDEGMARSAAFDMTYALFRGRGNESFSDELIRIFRWMQLRTRRPFPDTERTVFSMRPWDHFFWNVELFDFSAGSMILPCDWVAEPSNFFPARTEFFRSSANTIRIKSKADRALVFLPQNLVDFDRPIEVYFNGKKISPTGGRIRADVRVLLEDVRTRGDRLHPFWGVVDSQSPQTPNRWPN